MSTEPRIGVIERESLRPLFDKKRQLYTGTFYECLCYGSHILADFAEGSDGKIDNHTLLLFFRRVLTIIDAVTVLTANLAFETVRLQLRVLIEICIILCYLLHLKGKERSRAIACYTYCCYREELELLSKWGDKGKLPKGIAKSNSLFNKTQFLSQKYLRRRTKHLKQILNKAEYAEIQLEYDRILVKRQKNGRSNLPVWHMLFDGPKSLQDMASIVGLFVLYQEYYREYSRDIHHNDVYSRSIGDMVGENKVAFIPIRNMYNSEDVLGLILLIISHTYGSFVLELTPDKIENFAEWGMNILRPLIEQISEAEQDNV